MRVLVCGSRSWRAHDVMHRRLATLPRTATIMHGAARGADRMAGAIAYGLGLEVAEYPADWSLGGRAGIHRNLEMLDRQPDLVLAFWDGRSTGTKHVIDEARRRRIRLEVIQP